MLNKPRLAVALVQSQDRLVSMLHSSLPRSPKVDSAPGRPIPHPEKVDYQPGRIVPAKPTTSTLLTPAKTSLSLTSAAARMSESSQTPAADVRAHTCTNPAHRHLHLAPVPCPDCRGWLDRDGQVLTTTAMIARYPHMVSHINATPREQLPDYAPTRADAFWELNRTVGRLAWALILLLITGVVLAGLIVLLARL